MKVTIKTKEFLRFYQAFKDCNGIGSFLWFNVEKGSFYLQSCKSKEIRIKIEAEVEGEGFFRVNLLDLKDLIQKKYEEITFEQSLFGNILNDKINAIKITQTKMGYPPIVNMIAEDLTKPEYINLVEPSVEYELKTFYLNNKEVKMEKYIDFCSKEITRTMINCYILQNHDLICCTGHILAKIKNVCDVDYLGEAIHIPLDFTEFIKNQNLKIQVHYNKQQTNFKIVELISDEIYIKYSEFERELPVESIIYPQDDLVQINMDNSLQSKDLKCFEIYKSKKFDGTIDVGFQISKNELELQFLDETKEKSLEYTIKKYMIKEEILNDICFYFNWKYIKSLLKVLNDQLKSFKLPKDMTIINKRLIVETEKEVFVIMGKRL